MSFSFDPPTQISTGMNITASLDPRYALLVRPDGSIEIGQDVVVYTDDPKKSGVFTFTQPGHGSMCWNADTRIGNISFGEVMAQAMREGLVMLRPLSEWSPLPPANKGSGAALTYNASGVFIGAIPCGANISFIGVLKR